MEKISFNIRFFVLILTAFLFTACTVSSSTLPDKSRDLTEFIPTSNDSNVETETVEITNFVEQNFPENCVWEKFERVVDGDTIVTENYRVRMIGIDTPEIKDPRKPIEAFGLESSEFAEDFFNDAGQVCLIESVNGDKFDKYKRKLAYVFSEDGRDYNVEILKTGLAKGYFYFPFDRKAEFQQTEKIAKEQNLGLWKSK